MIRSVVQSCYLNLLKESKPRFPSDIRWNRFPKRFQCVFFFLLNFVLVCFSVEATPCWTARRRRSKSLLRHCTWWIKWSWWSENKTRRLLQKQRLLFFMLLFPLLTSLCCSAHVTTDISLRSSLYCTYRYIKWQDKDKTSQWIQCDDIVFWYRMQRGNCLRLWSYKCLIINSAMIYW